jgi:GH24 family phage-related lysozyme (muramidase)
MDEQDSSKLRRRSAIEAAHAGVVGEDEARLDATISRLYGVESEEAAEIHANYHIDKILASLARRAGENGMKRETLTKRVKNLDISGAARQVASSQKPRPSTRCSEGWQ